MPMTREQVRPGVTVIVPKTADRTRPGRAYRLEISAAYDAFDPDWVRVDGLVLRLDGTPTTGKYPGRCADLLLASIEAADEPAGSERGPAGPQRPTLHDFHFEPVDWCEECQWELFEAEEGDR